MKIVLVYNPKSGSSLGKSVLRKKCQTNGIEVEKFIAMDEKIAHKLAPYIKEAQIIGVIGGDGTISTVAGIVANTKATLLPIPGGTLNHFTKDLGVPQDVDEALAQATQAKPRNIDIASVNDTYFINNSSIGIYPASLHRREEIEPRVGKWPAAIAASLRALVSFKTHRVTIDNSTFSTPFVFIGNNRYALDSFERTALDNAILTVFIAKTKSRLTLLKIACFALIGKTNQVPEFDEINTKEINIEAKRQSISVSHDGEVSQLTAPLHYKIHTGALKIIG